MLALDPQLAGETVTRNMATHFIHAGDEWYILAEEADTAGRKTYDGYLQLENGVGMIRLLQEEVDEQLEELPGDDRKRHVTIATGELAAPYSERSIGDEVRERNIPNVDVQVN